MYSTCVSHSLPVVSSGPFLFASPKKSSLDYVNSLLSLRAPKNNRGGGLTRGLIFNLNTLALTHPRVSLGGSFSLLSEHKHWHMHQRRGGTRCSLRDEVTEIVYWHNESEGGKKGGVATWRKERGAAVEWCVPWSEINYKDVSGNGFLLYFNFYVILNKGNFLLLHFIPWWYH